MNAIAPDCNVEYTGIRAGEKIHEVLLSEDEARQSLDLDDMFVIQPIHNWWSPDNWTAGKPLPDGFRYGSDNNSKWLTADELREMVGIQL